MLSRISTEYEKAIHSLVPLKMQTMFRIKKI